MRAGWVAVVLCLVQAAAGRRIPWWSIKIAQEQGPNACVVEEVPGTYTEIWTECRYWINREICGQKTIIRYECCEGYQQLGEDQNCTSVKPLKNILQTAEDLGARRFVAAVTAAGLAPELSRDGAFTLFLPTDAAFQRMSSSLRGTLEASAGDPRSPVLLYHLLDGKLTTKDMGADQLVETKSAGAKLRLNKYSNQMTTVNCNLLVRKDQKATNGVVHLIDAVLDPSFLSSRSVIDLVVQDGRFSVLAEALEASGYIQELRRMPGALTILAPSDEAFQKLPERRREKILNDKVARDALLKNHIIPHPVCKSAVIGNHKMRSESGSKLEFNCNRDSVFVDRSKITQDEIAGQNGVIHMLDDLLIPDRAMNFLELAEKHQLLTFLNLVRVAGLEEAFGDFGDYTIFVPDENAFLTVPEGLMEAARSDTEAARDLLLFHGTQGRIFSKDISDNQVVMSLDEENPLRLHVHRSALAVEDAIIQQADIEGQNGVMHIINRVLLPSNRSAADVLRRDGRFSILLSAMERVMAADPHSLDLRNDGVFTIFAPTDDAFQALGQAGVDALMSDIELLTKTVKNHVSARLLSSGSFQHDLSYQVATQHGSVDLHYEGDELMVGEARVLKRDIMNTNGVLHLIDKVLVPTELAHQATFAGSTSFHSSRTEYNGSGSSYSHTYSSSSSSSSHSSGGGRYRSGPRPAGTGSRYTSSSRRAVSSG
ncbi:transforming growth factor-beta-induced protein ig-h3-like [Pollicipes pollicipes]|uniref:transforming growth factor-beta-induced protein ig-h3-like n=1 Tax=Pollicipes pollicipes TaxID=41117 RepID=UPI0018858DDA|nr:transforming growth factor-beta-induced protein ig-h3-like [Pollicipes pollicipes]